tara:strand:- start:56 stop:2515 length:2460 start_codon:yes stop_codon:yes gene_type:complete
MKVSQNWLKELVDINATPEELSEKLSVGGFEVESLVDTSSKVKGIVLGKVVSVVKHNNSEKLSICKVDIGAKQLQIICGATNVRSDIYVYVATIGTYLDKANLTIKASEIRGVYSEGMICSLEEIGFEEKSEGIAIVEKSFSQKFKLGTPISELLELNDFIYELAITANRPDGMSMIGIAREVSALLQTKLTNLEISENLPISEFHPQIIKTNSINHESIYSITNINNVNGKNTSPKWLKDRLEISGIKSINLIVDITNYILLEQGQPLHAFDKEKLSKLIGKDVSQNDFGIRVGKEGETLQGLDGNFYKLNKNITIITCSDIPVAIAGVIGGIETSVTDSTTSIFLEAAVFNPTSIRKSSKEIGLRTESSSRFEKGISNKNTVASVKRAIKLFNEFFNITNQMLFISEDINNDLKIIKLRRDRIHKILGPIKIKSAENNNFIKRDLNDKEITDKLELIGCTLVIRNYGWDVEVIPNRSQDLFREIDLIEEIARLIGYDLFDENIPNPLIPGKLTNLQNSIRKIRNGFIHAGFNEVLTYSLVPNDDNKRIRIANPLLKETSCLRNNLWEEHIKIVNQNINAGNNNCWIFEIGKIFTHSNKTFIEEEFISGAICGNNKFESWDISGKKRDLDYFEARGKLRESLDSLKITIQDKTTENIDFLHPGRSALLFLEGKELGYFGQIHPKYHKEKNTFKNLYLFSIKLTNISEACTRKNKWHPAFKDYPTVPKIERDINLIFNKKFLINEIITSIRKSGKKLMEDVNLVDVYSDESIGKDNISYTFRLSYRDHNKTLKDSDIAELNRDIILKIEKKYSAKIRSS